MNYGRRCVCVLAMAGMPAWPALYQGTIKESRFGMGIDSVKISVKGSQGSVYSDSLGHFSLATTAVYNSGRRQAELLWSPGNRTVAWNAVDGAVAILVSDAGGKVLHRLSAPSSPDRSGTYRMPSLQPGIYFASVRAAGKAFTWRWFENGSAAGAPGPALPNSPGLAFPLEAMASARTRALAKASAMDSIVFERKGFDPVTRAMPGSDASLEIKMVRQPIKVLIVDGKSNHDWRQTTKIVRAIYALGGFFSVDVTTAPDRATASAWQAWQPDFKKYEVVMMNFNGGDVPGSLEWPRDKQLLLEEYVKGGGGLYALHAANNSFPAWKEYNNMIGTGWRKADFGTALEVGTDGQIIRIPAGAGNDTHHGGRVDAPIHILHRHPINKGYPTAYLAATLEVYSYARGPAANCEVLSYAYDSPASAGTLLNWPIEILIDYGKGQVYNATQGHVGGGEIMPNAVRDVSFQTTLLRATEWLARKEVLTPVPAVFNTESKVAFRDLTLP